MHIADVSHRPYVLQTGGHNIPTFQVIACNAKVICIGVTLERQTLQGTYK
jgi:hypothetical protein